MNSECRLCGGESNRRVVCALYQARQLMVSAVVEPTLFFSFVSILNCSPQRQMQARALVPEAATAEAAAKEEEEAIKATALRALQMAESSRELASATLVKLDEQRGTIKRVQGLLDEGDAELLKVETPGCFGGCRKDPPPASHTTAGGRMSHAAASPRSRRVIIH